MVVAPPKRSESAPWPDALRAFFVPGTVGLMLWCGTRQRADAFFPATPGGTGFGFLSDAITHRELEKQQADGTRPKLTQAIDYRASHIVRFRVVDPAGLLASSGG